VSRDFILQGIRAGNLEYREGSVWGNPYLRILRSQLEQFIEEQFGSQHLGGKKAQSELRKLKKEIASLKKRLATLKAQKAEIEATIGE
jgi:flagellar motility protein MotE (MotC chaperone)